MAFKKIAVAVDYSDYAKHAANVADELAQLTGGTLTLIHVVPIIVPPMIDLTVMLPPPDLGKLTAAADAELRAWRAMLKTPSERVFIRTLTGDPTTVLTDESAKFDLVVVGTHGRRGLSRALLGSVAERLSRGAACPVLIARKGAGEPRP